MKNRIVKGFVVQRIGWIVAVLIVLGWLASEIPLQIASSNDQPKVQTCWRRTVDGWENSNQWCFYTATPRPSFHPFYLGMMQCAAVSWVAIACYMAKSTMLSDRNDLPQNDKL